MSETKFTPGPWEVDGNYPLDIIAGGLEVARSCDSDNGGEYSILPVIAPRGEEADANARLIAAAPELYAALEALKKQVTELLIPAVNKLPPGTGVDLPTLLEWGKTVEMVDNSLAKARGESITVKS